MSSNPLSSFTFSVIVIESPASDETLTYFSESIITGSSEDTIIEISSTRYGCEQLLHPPLEPLEPLEELPPIPNGDRLVTVHVMVLAPESTVQDCSSTH